ncbi:MAG: capsule biosynthesis protein [Chloroflexi bacterium]|nr:capsule biosynthesis protein [Chloroflexota bacterium]
MADSEQGARTLLSQWARRAARLWQTGEETSAGLTSQAAPAEAPPDVPPVTPEIPTAVPGPAVRPGSPPEAVPAGPKGMPNWRAILDTDRELWARSLERAKDGPAILIGTTVAGSPAVVNVESLLAVALTLRGARVHALLCDRALPACLRCEPKTVPDPGTLERYELPSTICDGCYSRGDYTFSPLGLPLHRLSELLTDDERRAARAIAADVPFGAIRDFRLDGLAIGEHAYAGALRYYASGNLDAEPQGEMVARRYLEGALLTAFAGRRLLGLDRFSAACYSHGIYAPHGILNQVCLASDVRVVNWVVAYRKRCFVLSHGDTYHHTLMREPVAEWEDLPWNEQMDAEIMAYLRSRWDGTRDWIYYHEKPDEDVVTFAREIGLDLNRPILGLLTNVMWDAQLHYPANAFPDMLAWVLETIEYVGRRPDLQLLIRVHPAEIRGTVPSRQPIVPEIRRRFPELPSNVFIIPPESPVSTYAAVGLCDAVTIYGTKTGVELTSMGIPTIVAGEAWIRNKGLTRDAQDPASYFRILDELPFRARMPEQQVQRARMYAYHYFFRRMIPVHTFDPNAPTGPFTVAVSSLADLLPGRDPGLDVICDGIITGSSFVYPTERLGVLDV